MLHEIAATESRCEKRPRESPVIRRATPRLVDRTGRCERVERIAPACRGQAAERTVRFLELDQLRLARHRNARQRFARGDRVGLDVGENARKRRRVRLRMCDLARQAGELLALPRLGIARFQRIEPIVHASQRLRRR